MNNNNKKFKFFYLLENLIHFRCGYVTGISFGGLLGQLGLAVFNRATTLL